MDSCVGPDESEQQRVRLDARSRNAAQQPWNNDVRFLAHRLLCSL